MHIAQGVLRAINVNKLTKCGCVFKVSEEVGWCVEMRAMMR